MKRKLIFTLIMIMGLSAAAGCAGKDSAGHSSGNIKTVEDVLAEGTSEPEVTSKSEEVPTAATEETLKETSKDEPEEETAQTTKEGDIDVDLTVLSSTMVYSEVYNMMVKPDDYIGKTVKMTGMYSYYHDDATGNDYHACIIQDATACCAQGIEFTTTDEFKYPDDYPEMGEDVTVIGRFDIYYEGDFCFMTLLDARIVGTTTL